MTTVLRIKDISPQAQASDMSNITACLQFLAREAENAELAEVKQTIDFAIARIQKIPHQGKNLDQYAFQDLLQAFHLVVKFCMLEDADVKKQMAQQLQAIDLKTFEQYFENA